MLTPGAAGNLSTTDPVVLPISTQRLQASVSRNGIDRIAVWGNGEVGSVVFLSPVPVHASVAVAPGSYRAQWDGNTVEITAVPDVPVLVVDYEGTGLGGVRVRLPRVRYAGLDGAPRRRANNRRIRQSLPQGTLDAFCAAGEARGRSIHFARPRGTVVILAGEEAEVDALVALADPGEQTAVDGWRAKAGAYRAWLSSRFEVDDVVLHSMFVHCLHAAASSHKRDGSGRFAGLSAGYGYSLPARTYFRDGYWTILALLPFRPDLVRDEILVLARGVHENGEAPSGVILSSEAGQRYWDRLRQSTEEYRRNHVHPGDWWSDHFDSPLYFVLMALEYVAWTGDRRVLDESGAGESIWRIVERVLDRYEGLGDDAPRKPYHDRDWADNVYRGGYVTYDLGLYYGALALAADLAPMRAPHREQSWRARMDATIAAIRRHLWMEDRGYFAEYAGPAGAREEHLAIETVTALRYGCVTPAQRASVLGAYSRLLETRHNDGQPYGDWGVMCAFPPYSRITKTRAKSSFPYRYHNGSDWPYWDGVYAQLLLEDGNGEWRYPLTRWWEYGLSRNRPEPVEFYAPPWGIGSALQGWSGTPVAAVVSGGFGVGPGKKLKAPPWGDSAIRGVQLRGRTFDVAAAARNITVT